MSEHKEAVASSEAVISLVANDLVDKIGQEYVLGHAFLWVSYKVGNKKYKTIAAYGACGNWSEIQSELKRACPEIVSSWVNLD